MSTNVQSLNRFQLRRVKTRAALLACTRQLIAERGYDGFSVQDITDHADLGRGTFYLYFQDKEEIVWEILKEGFEAGLQAQASLMAHLSQAERDYLGYYGFFAYLSQYRGMFQAVKAGRGVWRITTYITAYTVQMAKQRLQVGDLWADLQPAEESLCAHFMTGALMEVAQYWLTQPENTPVADIAGLFYRLLHGKPAPKLPFEL